MICYLRYIIKESIDIVNFYILYSLQFIFTFLPIDKLYMEYYSVYIQYIH